MKSGAKGADVVRLQLALRAAGYSKVPTNGTFGKSTVTAVSKSAQKRRDLKQTGIVDSAGIWKALQKGQVTAPSAKKAPAVKKKKKAHRSKGERALAYARKQLGDRYRYGGTGPKPGTARG